MKRGTPRCRHRLGHGGQQLPKLVGLSYEFQSSAEVSLVGDRNADGRLQDAERLATPFNDPYPT